MQSIKSGIEDRVTFVPTSCGGGKQIVDRLRAQGYFVTSIGFGEGAEDKQAYINRRAAMPQELRDICEMEDEIRRWRC